MSSLLSKGKEDYGDFYAEHFFEQYKIYVESMEKISDRRQKANNYFIAINTALISFLGLPLQATIFGNIGGIKFILTLAGILICVVFWFLIRSYRQLNTGKFEVLHELEKHLPVALYAHEWKVLKEGKNYDKYYPFSHIEPVVPIAFGVIYFVLSLYFFFETFCS